MRKVKGKPKVYNYSERGVQTKFKVGLLTSYICRIMESGDKSDEISHRSVAGKNDGNINHKQIIALT